MAAKRRTTKPSHAPKASYPGPYINIEAFSTRAEKMSILNYAMNAASQAGFKPDAPIGSLFPLPAGVEYEAATAWKNAMIGLGAGGNTMQSPLPYAEIEALYPSETAKVAAWTAWMKAETV